jgi:bifunctional UDP-N-acetylglucosamine pyrophosphorylase/glucosamine-1-phosphate N-acetyltransferase
MKKLSAIVLGAGKGTRMKSEKAKVLHPVLGKPLAYYPLQRAFDLGASPVVAVVGHQAEMVEKELAARFPGKALTFARQTQQLGTAHAVRSAEANLQGFSGDVLILYGDVPLLRREMLETLLAAHRGSPGPLTLVTFRPESPKGYGRVVREAGQVKRIVEDKDCSSEQKTITECNAGIYVADSAFLWEALRGIKADNAQGEYYLTDLVAAASSAGASVATVEATVEEVAGVNDRRELSLATQVMQARINTAHQLAGVTLLDPRTVYIDESVEIGNDTEIGPGVMLLGNTKIGAGCSIGAGCVLTDSVVGEGSTVKPYSVFEEAHAGARNQIGPFSRLRPGTELSEDVHLGNFVETKKARLGKGSKANHLSYLGDAVIGAGCNIGAGTITCNYDGVNKHTTTLGDRVFIGSDTQLVAPVSVGDGAYVGAGATVTSDVPANALAVSRTPQKNVEGWAEKKRAKQAAARAAKK